MKNFFKSASNGANSDALPTRTGPPPAGTDYKTTSDEKVDGYTYNNAGNGSDDMQYGSWDAEAANNGERRGSRIDKPTRKSIVGVGSDDASEDSVSVGKQIAMEANNAIKYRTCSWQKTAALLFSEYICLAIMSFPYSYSILGLVPGLILTIIVAALVLYTSLVVWEFCLRHPEVRDVCDIGQMLFFNSKIAWWFTAVMFLLNNTFIMGFHCLVGSKYLNTISGNNTCTIAFSVVLAVISWVCSMPRTFNILSILGTGSAVFTFISVLLATIFAGIQEHPAGWPYNGTFIQVLVTPTPGTTFVAGMSAFLNISYTFIGQITIPSFIAEMKEPRDFPKALWAVTIAEIAVFSICGAITYAYTGTNYNTAPAFGSLQKNYEDIAFSFMIPTLIFLGVLYASVSARFIFFNLFSGTKHMSSHTVKGWAAWAGILAVLWFFAFIIAEVIPFFSDMLSLMSSLFDSFFGFIFWGVAYLRMRYADYGAGFWRQKGVRSMIGVVVNVWLIAVGFFFLGAGTYVSVQSILDGYAASNFGHPFTCAPNGLGSAYTEASPGPFNGASSA